MSRRCSEPLMEAYGTSSCTVTAPAVGCGGGAVPCCAPLPGCCAGRERVNAIPSNAASSEENVVFIDRIVFGSATVEAGTWQRALSSSLASGCLTLLFLSHSFSYFFCVFPFGSNVELYTVLASTHAEWAHGISREPNSSFTWSQPADFLLILIQGAFIMKRFAATSLSVATTFLALSGSGFALDQSQTIQLMSGPAELNQTLDTKTAAQGQAVSARLTGAIQTPEGLKLPNGTELLGHVDQVRAAGNNSDANLTLTFDKARLKDGKEVAIKATLIEVNSPGTLSGPGTKVSSDGKFDQVTSTPGQTLHSEVPANNSGTLVRKDKDIHLVKGSELIIAVAPEGNASVAGN